MNPDNSLKVSSTKWLSIAKVILILFTQSIVCFFLPNFAFSKVQEVDQISVSKGAFAANAGGQEAYSIRYFHNMKELQFFANRSLTVGRLPLIGVGYGPRFNGCEDCFWKPFIQTDAGFSNAGPFIELDWGITFPVLPIWLPVDPPKYVPQLRLDFATHLIFSQLRPSVWSYPLWFGVALPF